MFLEGFTQSLSSYLDGLSATGLDLVVEGVDDVIAQINVEQDRIKPEVFKSDGTISPASFGGGDTAPLVALHHTRAHEVIGTTLDGIKADLEALRQACIDAKNAIISADEESAARMSAAQRAVESLVAGSTTDRSDRAYEQARQNQDVTGGVDL